MQQEELIRKELLAEVESIASLVGEHAGASEVLGRLDEATMAALRSTRLLQYLAPRELGGLEADPVTQLLVLEAIARIDASTSWTLGILAGVSGIAGAYLPVATTGRLFAETVPPIVGSLLPKGTAERVPGGYRVRGRWPYGSGIHHAKWVGAGTVVLGEPIPQGARLVYLPREQVVIHDNWQVAGLRASGSSDYSIEDQFVPEGMTFSFTDLFAGQAVTGGAAFRLGMPAWVASFHIGIALGIARRALDEIHVQATEKGRGFPPSALPTQPHVQFALGKAEIELASVRAYGLQVMGDLWVDAQTGHVPPPARQAEVRAAGSYITEVAQRVTTTAFQAAGGTALFDTNPLQRCFRDITAAGQHFAVSQSAYRAVGMFKLNQPDANPMM
jgi:alkylation response protein AidB-like acyl-CoA dehydrogenase